ncbi:MAG: hypothetical protein WB873_10080, partial [Thermoplasmata archaeon]
MASEGGAPVRVERALLSVDDKTGVAELARGLVELRVELWATGGTRSALSEAQVPVGAAEELTGVSDWFGGREPARIGLLARGRARRREHARLLRAPARADRVVRRRRVRDPVAFGDRLRGHCGRGRPPRAEAVRSSGRTCRGAA